MGISSVTGTWEIGANWPYPKIYFTDYYVMSVAVKGSNLAVYDMTNSANVWTATERVDLGAKSGIISVDIAGFDIYTVITVNKGATKEVYERDPTTKAITLTSVTVIPGGNSCCNANGQLVIGGLYSTAAPWSVLGTCSIAWGDIGSNIMIPGDVLGTSDIVAGYRKLPWDENANNEILKVLPIDNMIAVYGDSGIGLCKMGIVDKRPAMSFKPLSNRGVVSTYAVNGCDLIHGFVDEDFEWNIMTKDGIKNLGYRNILKAMTGEIVVSYDGLMERFYISDGLVCYVYTKDGMYSTHQCVSSIGSYKKILCGFILDNSDEKIRLTTTAFDTRVQDMKTLESIETGLTYATVADEDVYATFSTKYNFKGDFIDSPRTVLNDRGIVTRKLTGREFKISLDANYEAGGEFQLGNLKAKLKYSDRRNTRGRKDVS